MIPEPIPFTSLPLNNGRQMELDIMKGLAIMLMVLIHSFERFSPQPLPDTFFTYAIEFICSPGAPIFMFLLGVGLVYTRKNSPVNMFRRGVIIFLIGYLLNFCRGTLLYLFYFSNTGDAGYLAMALNEFRSVDILQFAGLTFMFFALTIKLKFQIEHYLLAAVLMAGIFLLGEGFRTETALSGALAGLFWGADDYAYFPFFTWIEYPIFGYIFGNVLIRCQDKGRLYRAMLMIAIPATILFRLYCSHYGIDFGAADGLYQQSYYHHDLMGTMTLLSMALAYISLVYYATPLVPGLLQATFSRWSHNINNIYCISWLIIYWSSLFMPASLNVPGILAYFAVVLMVSDWMAVKYLQIKAQYMIKRLESRP